MRTNPLIDTIYSTAKGNDAEKVSDEVRRTRLAQCQACKLDGGEKKWNGFKGKVGENGLMKTGQCKICACFVELKTEYKHETCPKGKW